MAGCAAVGPVNDGTSLAYGTTAGGMLLRGRKLPAGGEGRRIPPRVGQRGEHSWILVRALLSDPAVDVQYLFISEGLKQLLLDHAEAIKEPTELIERARLVLHQPVGALPHDDHLHLRIYCPAGDRILGCKD